MNAPTPDPGSHRRRAPYVVGALVVATLVGAGTVAYATGGSAVPSLGGTPAAAEAKAPAPAPTARLAGVNAQGVQRWDSKLRVVAANGTIQSVTGTGGEGVRGAIGADGTWTSSTTLVPSSTYALVASVLDGDGKTVSLPLKARTTAPTKTLEAALSPGDDKTVGIGQTAIVRLDRSVESVADRKAVEKRLTVTTTPSQPGAWRWMSDRELHYRGATFWKPGTTISVKTALDKTRLSGGIWGAGTRSTTFKVGSALTSVVDIKNHTMTVSRDGKVLRTMKASMGKPGFDTRGGTFIVLEKFATKVMDGSTLATPQDYSTKVKDAVRITNSGTFTHGAPWSVGSQGRRNVSHGCINLSPADAAWYFDQARRGDVVKVVNAVKGPLSYDAGSQDWNMSFAEWKSASDGA